MLSIHPPVDLVRFQNYAAGVGRMLSIHPSVDLVQFHNSAALLKELECNSFLLDM